MLRPRAFATTDSLSRGAQVTVVCLYGGIPGREGVLLKQLFAITRGRPWLKVGAALVCL